MEAQRRVLVIDDGELARFRTFFKGSKVEVQHLRGDVRPEDLEGSFDLVIASVKRTLSLEDAIHLDSLPGKPTWIAVHAQDFLPLRVRLKRMGVHFLLQSSVGTEALRLLMIHCLHHGPEQREALRLPVGIPVKCRVADGDPMDVDLLDLTATSVRIVTPGDIAPGSDVEVELPAKLAGGNRLSLPGRAKRSDPHRDTGKWLVIVKFEELRSEATELLEAILQGKVIGTVVTRLGDELSEELTGATIPSAASARAPAAPVAGAPAATTSPQSAPDPLDDQAAYRHPRRNRRSTYTREVTALLSGEEIVVLGRDLSIAGMRTDRLPELSVGTPLELAIYGASGAEPVLVQAVVARDDGELGTVFHFTGMADWERPRLQAIVHAVPEIRSLEYRGRSEKLVVSRVQTRRRQDS